MASISRRKFLSLGSLAALSLAARLPLSDDDPPSRPLTRLGRTTRSLPCFDEPTFSAKEIRIHPTDSILTLYEEQQGDAGTSRNTLWFRVADGWVHSSFVQPVQRRLNSPVQSVRAGGLLAEVTVPFTEAWRNDDRGLTVAYRFYYSSTHWIDRVVTDAKGNSWYRILDDRYEVYDYALAKHLRPVPDDELAPLSLHVSGKRIEVDLAQQRLVAFEGDAAVFTARLSSGRPGSETPTGRFQVRLKRPSRHMAAADIGGNGFDLPGVPWVSYFHWSGVAFHGTYWHNDYGRPRSRGCINLRPEDAKWIYRWTAPAVPPGKHAVEDKRGTEVLVF